MKIVIIGDGKVGHKLTTQLSEENYDVVLIDRNEGKLKEAINNLDIMCINGDGADAQIQRQAGVPNADLVIACASTDELNMVSCLLARKLGAKHTIARVRNPIYYQQIDLLKEDLRLSMAVNPELAVAFEISRAILLPDTAKVETFMKGKAELVEYIVKEQSRLDGMKLSDIYQKYQIKLLICAVRRGNDVIIPDGDFLVKVGDRLHLVASHKYIEEFFRFVGRKRKVKKVMICGGSRVAYYLAKQLIALGMQVKISEKDRKKCESLCEELPKATIICGDAADHDLLIEEGIEEADAMINLTNVDEENIILALFGRTKGVDKIVAKVNEDSRAQLVQELDIDALVSTKTATADAIMSYVRARQNSLRSVNVESMYQLVGGRVVALEFIIKEETNYTNIPLKELSFKANNLIACIGRGRQVIIPDGDECMKVGDSVVMVTTEKKVQDITDIML